MIPEPLVPPHPPAATSDAPVERAWRSRRSFLVALAAVIAIAAAARLTPWPHVFATDGVRLTGDGDSYYHALRAERLARDWPHVPWTDPGMNFPYGADIPWPPLFDQVIATAARLTGSPTPEHVALVAAWVALLVGLAVVLLSGALSTVLVPSRNGERDGWRGLDAALVLAFLPSAVRHGMLGRSDHHAAEVLLATAAFLGYAWGMRGTRAARLAPWLVGASIALAFWNWPGSALYPVVMVVHLAAWHVFAPPDEPSVRRAARTLAGGAAIATLLLAISVAAWGPPGSITSGSLTPITGLSVALCGVTAFFAAAISAARARDRDAQPLRRAAHAVLAGIVPLALVVGLVPSMRTGIVHGLTAVGAANTWYAWIGEFRPLLLSGRAPWWYEVRDLLTMFGLAPLLVPAAGSLCAGGGRARPEARAMLSFLAVWSGIFIVLTIVRRRFDAYAAVPFAACAAWGVREAVRRLGRRGWTPRVQAAIRVAGLVGVVAPGLPLVASGELAAPGAGGDATPLLTWMRGQAPPVPGREGVIAGWSYGHHVQWFARKPVVSTPFGTDIDERSMTDAAAFFLARDEESAVRILDRRRIGFILLTHPLHEVAALEGFAPELPPLVIQEPMYGSQFRYRIRRDLFELFVSHLYFFDGTAGSRPGTSIGTVRLLAETEQTQRAMGIGLTVPSYKLFGTVPGALLEVQGVPPGSIASASVDVRTNAGRAVTWTAAEGADGTGVARLRVPYATGRNGQSVAGAYVVAGGAGAQTLPVSEADVLGGGVVRVDLSRASVTPAAARR